MKRWFMEPMLHFLFAGALLFAAYAWLNREGEGEPRVVRISAAEVNWLKETWTRQWQRPPDEHEIRGLVADYLKEGLLAREARELGMDENDTIVRRRLAQKMEFLVQNTARLAEPVEAELRRLYRANRANYQSPARISFTQIYFSTEPDAKRSLRRIESLGGEPLGEPTLLEQDYRAADQPTVTNLFGPEFASSVFGLETGRWHGPVRSAYGFHLVRIGTREDPRQRNFAEVRAEVLEEWHRQQQDRAYADFLAALYQKYDVVVEPSVAPLVGSLVEPPL
jgi:PPIC-type PPIASE domain